MELSYDNVTKWFNDYFKAFNDNEGDPEKAKNMRHNSIARVYEMLQKEKS